jgi:hypothetical protein
MSAPVSMTDLNIITAHWPVFVKLTMDIIPFEISHCQNHHVKVNLDHARIKVTVFWDVALCSLAEFYWRFRGACCLCHQGPDYLDILNLILRKSVVHGRTKLWTSALKKGAFVMLCRHAQNTCRSQVRKDPTELVWSVPGIMKDNYICILSGCGILSSTCSLDLSTSPP